MTPFATHPFTDAYKAVRVIETLENYAVADQMDILSASGGVKPILSFNDEGDFWRTILANPGDTFDMLVSLAEFTVSEWVPRVPGLYWNENATQIRLTVQDGRPIYEPYGKSQFVLGGIGTNLFAPDTNGQRIVSLNRRSNVSSGIPLLISNAIWSRLSLEPNSVLTLSRVRWQRMAQEWSQRFESVNGIPRAYLYLEDESQLRVIRREQAQIHQPYSILEYTNGDALLYDYVFCNVYSNDTRPQIADFFEMYRVKYGNNGRYLLTADPANPLFEADYDSPEQLRRAESGGRYHLDIIKERIRGTYFKGKRAGDILQIFSRSYADSDSIKRIATYLKFPAVQFASNRPADRIAQLVDWCIDSSGKMEELIDKLTVENPDLLTN